ncbi:hypothetical protein GQ457_02G004930 [Hibiscus cannabinus]
MKILFFVLVAACILFIGKNGVEAAGANGICCQDHPETGKCTHGVEDDPTGSCTIFCKNGGCKGAICKAIKGDESQCHCYC